MSATATQTQQRQVKVQLTTNDPTITLPDAIGPILVNTNLRRYGLSTLINYLLETSQPIPLDFLIDGTTFLRTSIDDYLASNGLSAETILTAEYVRATLPPVHVASFPHDDWLSSVDVLTSSSPAGQWSKSLPASGQERILTSSFDGSLRIWNQSQEALASTPPVEHRGSKMAVKSARFISSSEIVSTGYDRVVRLWKYDEQQSEQATLAPRAEFYGHKWFVNRLAVHAPSKKILSASDDRTVGLWSTDPSEAPPAPADLLPQGPFAKRRKTDSVSVPQKGALSLLKSHTDSVTDVIFDLKDYTVGYSVSQDKSLRVWDLTTSTAIDTRSTSHPLLSVAMLAEHSLLAAGTSVRHISLIDPRASATKVVTMTLRGHKSWVSCLASDPTNPNRLLSGSYDGTCRIWDIRATRQGDEGVVGDSVFEITRPGAKELEAKVFDCMWDKDLGILSGGEDKKLQINRSPQEKI